MKHDSRLAWIDMLLGMLATFSFLFMLSFLMIHPKTDSKKVELKAEYMVTMSWPASNMDDIDLHLLLPDNQHLFYKTREIGYALLDHDDRGTTGIWTDDKGVSHLGSEHKEILTLREKVPGHYVVNIQVFTVNDRYGEFISTPKLPYTVHVVLTRLNPTVVDVATVDILVSFVGEQKTAFAFDIAEDGSVNVDTTVDIPFIEMLDLPERTTTNQQTH